MDYVKCTKCGNTSFTRIFKIKLDSNNIKKIEEFYQCTICKAEISENEPVIISDTQEAKTPKRLVQDRRDFRKERRLREMEENRRVMEIERQEREKEMKENRRVMEIERQEREKAVQEYREKAMKENPNIEFTVQGGIAVGPK